MTDRQSRIRERAARVERMTDAASAVASRIEHPLAHKLHAVLHTASCIAASLRDPSLKLEEMDPPTGAPA